MEKLGVLMNQKFREQMGKFFVAGVSAVTTDLIVYKLLISLIGPEFAKGISFLTGTCVSYIINKYWTFNVQDKSKKEVARFLCLYSSTLLLNVLTNAIVLEKTELVWLSFLLATAVSMTLNFIGQKWWVFKS